MLLEAKLSPMNLGEQRICNRIAESEEDQDTSAFIDTNPTDEPTPCSNPLAFDRNLTTMQRRPAMPPDSRQVDVQQKCGEPNPAPKRSNRGERAFIGVNCAAIPTSLIASELFGHEKGAFTGATQRRLGRFESANGGTLFLDEVGDLPPEIQIALLRVLQEREIERVGSNKPISIDVRVLAATHHDLEALVAEGKFRQDLLYRLSVVPIQIPSLRERKEDIPLLVEYFIGRFGKKAGKKFRTIDKKTVRLFEAYQWPGNVRELQNVIERGVILCEGEIFSVDETWLRREPAVSPSRTATLNGTLVRQEKEMIEAALFESQGRISGPAGAAAKLGLPARTLDSKIKRLRINKFQFKKPQASCVEAE